MYVQPESITMKHIVKIIKDDAFIIEINLNICLFLE